MSERNAAPRGRWLWLSLLPLGLGAWAPLLAGLRCRVGGWTAFGALWSALALAGWIMAGESSGSGGESSGVGLMLVAWAGGVVTSCVIYRSNAGRLGASARRRVAWPKPTARSREWSVRYAVLASYVCTFTVVLGLSAIFYLGLDVRLPVGAGVLAVDAVLLGALLPLKRRRGLSREDLGLRAVPAGRSFGLVLLALLAYGALGALWLALLRPHAAAGQLANVDRASTLSIVLAVAGVAISAPIVEEVFFRGLLYRSLRNRMAILPAALLAGALFGLVHITGYPLDTLPVKAAFGVIACLLYERTGSLLPGIALHWLVDASAVDFALTGSDLIVLLAAIVLVILTFAGSRLKSRRADAHTAPSRPDTRASWLMTRRPR